MNQVRRIALNLLSNPNRVCPIIVSEDGYVIDGNHRVLAARAAGLDTLPGVILPVKIQDIKVQEVMITWNPFLDGSK